MSDKKYLSIKYKQMMVIMTVCVVILGLAISLFFLYELEDEERRTSTELDNKATLIAANISSALIFKDSVSAHETLQTLKVDPSVLFAILFDEKDKQFAHYSQQKYTSELEVFEVKPEGVYLEKEFVEVLRPVNFKSNRVGTIFVRSDLVGLEETIVNLSYIGIFIFFG